MAEIQRRLAFASLACLIATAPASAARADEPSAAASSAETGSVESARPTAAPRGIEEIIVTGRKREEPIQETPISMVAFTNEDLDTKAITQVDEIGQTVPGLKFDTTVGSNSNTRIFIRGVGQASGSDELDPGVGLYVDGVYYPRASGSLLRVTDLERIEVLRGPQGTLFGKNTVGGVVHLITRKPGTQMGGRLQVRQGNLGLFETQLSVDMPISIGALEERAFTRISFATATDDGFIRNVLDGENGGDNKQLATRIALRLLPGDDVEANLTFERSRENQKAPLGECRRVVDVALSKFAVDNSELFSEACDESSVGTGEFEAFSNDALKGKQDIMGTTGVLTWDLGAFSLRSTSSWRQVSMRNRGGDTDGTRAEFLAAGPGKNKDDTVSHELLLQGRTLDDRMFVTTGAYWLREEGRSKGESVILRNLIADPDRPLVGDFSGPEDASSVALLGSPPTIRTLDQFLALRNGDPDALSLIETVKNTNRRTIEAFTTYSYAGFGEITYDLTDQLSLTGGLRYTQERKARRRKSLTIFGPAINSDTAEIKTNSGDNFSDTDARFDEWTGRLTFAYKVTADALLFGGFSRGFRSGGFDDSGVTDAATGSIDPFDTEKLESYELGIKTAWLENRLIVNLTGFYNQYNDIQLAILSLGSNGLPTVNIQNAGRALVQGLELDFQARPSWIQGLSLSGGLSFINADYKEFREDVVRDFTTDVCPNLRLADCPFERLAGLVAELRTPMRELNVDVSDRDFAQTPPFSYNVQAAYEIDLGRWGRLTPTVQWYHQGKTFQDVRNSKSIQQPKFGLLNGRVAWQWSDSATTVAFFARNILDRRYIVGALDLRQATGTNQAFFARPRTWGVEVIHEF